MSDTLTAPGGDVNDPPFPNQNDHVQAQSEPATTDGEDTVAMEISPTDSKPADPSNTAMDTSESASSTSKSSIFYPASQTSTVEYDQVPFVEFSKQVKRLCHSLWPPTPREYRIQRLLGGPNNRFMGVLRSKKLGRYLWPAAPPKSFEIDRMSGGSFNRIVGIKIIGSEKEDTIPLILRTSRDLSDSRPDREMAILQYIGLHTRVSVPQIKAFDLTEDNPLKMPYVIQNRVPGVCFSAAIKDGLSHKQWCTITKEVANVILELQKVENRTPGLIETSVKEDGAQTFNICAFDIRNPRDMEWKQRIAKSPEYEADRANALECYETKTLDFLTTQFGRWLREELRPCPFNVLYNNKMRELALVASEMNKEGIFGESKNCLVHMDLAARNIMVEVGPDDFIKITGVLDWDSAIFAPRFVSCRPPWWLWQDQEHPEDAMEDETNANIGAADDPELIEVKSIFDSIMGEEYVRCAYQPEYLIARRLFDIALHGNWSNETWREIDDIVKDWDTLQEAKKDKSPSASAPVSPTSSEEQQDNVGS
ncbi:hypothetical protein ACLMJK_008530 [Lecanora helva]